MQLWILSYDPIECATQLDSPRVIKSCLETVQILTGAVYNLGYTTNLPVKPTHLNHPATKWCTENKLNYHWTLLYLKAMLKEYTKRYGKVHKYEHYVSYFENLENLIQFPLICEPRTWYNGAMNRQHNLDYTYISDVREAYKTYLQKRYELSKKEL